MLLPSPTGSSSRPSTCRTEPGRNLLLRANKRARRAVSKALGAASRAPGGERPRTAASKRRSER